MILSQKCLFGIDGDVSDLGRPSQHSPCFETAAGQDTPIQRPVRALMQHEKKKTETRTRL
jgi:hypothetical protein